VVVSARTLAWVCAMWACAACAAPRAGVSAEGPGHVVEALRDLAPRASEKYTAVVFFSSDCHVLRAHDERLRALAAEFAERGVRFVAIDSEVCATAARDVEEASRRGYPFPILIDPGAKMAKAAGAAYAGYVVVLDPSAAIVYRGGIDSDRVHLTDDATPYLRHALADLVAGQSPRVAETKALGCALRTW